MHRRTLSGLRFADKVLRIALANIQGHHHAVAWFCIDRGKTLVQALKLIETEGILHPN